MLHFKIGGKENLKFSFLLKVNSLNSFRVSRHLGTDFFGVVVYNWLKNLILYNFRSLTQDFKTDSLYNLISVIFSHEVNL